MTTASPDLGATLRSLLEERAILVVVGTGGVGKTTVAAALAVEAARAGRRVLALTIDPARRLCDALGIEGTGGEAQELPQAALAHLGISKPGTLHAMMLDMKSTFDGLVDRLADSAEARQRIFENSIYQHVSDALAGSSEYAAMEMVFEVSESSQYDLIVVDTPPSQHALDFLDAPRRLVEFLDSRMMQLLLHPAMAAGRFGFRLFNRASQRVLQVLERISGVGFLEDISEFLLAFESMAGGFRERATEVRRLLLGRTSAFLIVAAPTLEGSRGAMEFLLEMQGTGVPVEGVLVNRMRLWPEGESPPLHFLTADPSARDMEALARALATAHLADASAGERDFDAQTAANAAVDLAKGYASLVQLDAAYATPLLDLTRRQGQLFGRIPEMPQDVADLDGLLRIGDFLFRNKTPDPSTPTER